MRDAVLLCLAANGFDRDGIIGDIISSNMSNIHRPPLPGRSEAL
jgi:hypothetical protein